MKNENDFIPTRQSLLSRLKDWSDHDSWKTFFDTYWRLIYGAAIKAGLNDAEAQDVVQETVIAVVKSMPQFKYDSKKGSFKGWLLQLTRWRIADQFRKRQTGVPVATEWGDSDSAESSLEQIADPASLAAEEFWEQEWETTILDAAVDRVKQQVDPSHFQVFDLYVVKGWKVTQVAKTLKINAAMVYLIKHRISKLISKEVLTLKEKGI